MIEAVRGIVKHYCLLRELFNARIIILLVIEIYIALYVNIIHIINQRRLAQWITSAYSDTEVKYRLLRRVVG